MSPVRVGALGFGDPASLAPKGGAAHRRIAAACRITTLDAAVEAELSAVVRRAAG